MSECTKHGYSGYCYSGFAEPQYYYPGFSSPEPVRVIVRNDPRKKNSISTSSYKKTPIGNRTVDRMLGQTFTNIFLQIYGKKSCSFNRTIFSYILFFSFIILFCYYL